MAPLPQQRNRLARRKRSKDGNVSAPLAILTIALIFGAFWVGAWLFLLMEQQKQMLGSTATDLNNDMAKQRRVVEPAAAVGAMQQEQQQTQEENQEQKAQKQQQLEENQQKREDDNHNGYDYFRALAVDLAGLPPSEALDQLRTNDPFGTRTFERRLLEEETRLARTLQVSELQALFPCPRHVEDDNHHQGKSKMISQPDMRNHTKAQLFRQEEPGFFIFFQHLRKAGGTQFCSLAEHNFPRRKLPQYYCMPDYHWKDTIGSAGSLHHYTNKVIADHMRHDGFVIAGNEWDTFDRAGSHFDLPATFVTSFRKPLDRALSQFRFECVEDRGCKVKKIETYWERRQQLHNVYTQTFADPDLPQDSSRPYHTLSELYVSHQPEHAEQRRKMMGDALDTIRQFHLVTSLEFFSYAGPMIQAVLGFQNTDTITKRVRPHIEQFQRQDGQDENKLGAAGIKKASWDPQQYLSKEQYQRMSETLALDEILTDAARRFFLERLVCQEF